LLAAYKGYEKTFNMLKAYVIGNFKKPEYDQQIEVLSQSQLAVIYVDGSVPIAHGWHGVFQQNGESPKTVSVFSSFDLGTRIYTSRYCEIAFSFADNIPSAILRVSQKETWGGTAFRVRVPNPLVGTLETLRLDMGNDVLGEDATIYCYTTPKGIVKVIKAACSNDVVESTNLIPNELLQDNNEFSILVSSTQEFEIDELKHTLKIVQSISYTHFTELIKIDDSIVDPNF
jgi:hypothetical protein